MSGPVAIGEPRRWTLHAAGEPDAGELIGTPRGVYLVLDSRRMADRFQTDVHGLTRWRLTVVSIDPASASGPVFPTKPCRTDGTPR